MKYNLNLTKEYCSHWTIEHALRELIANNIDEGGKLEYFPPGEDEPGRVAFMTTTVLPIEAFLMGYSVKTKTNAIGQFGEGLKIAMLIFARSNFYVEFYAGPHRLEFSFETPPGFGVETLHVTLVEDELLLNNTSTTIIVHNITKTDLDRVYTDAPLDSVFEGKGLYCQGLLVERGFYLNLNDKYWGVNVNQPVGTNRDRTYFSEKHLVIPIYEKTFRPEAFLDMSTSWFTSSIFDAFSPEYAQRVAKAYVEKNVNQNRITAIDFSKIRVIFPRLPDKRYAKKDGYFIGPYWFWGSNLNSNSDFEVLDELEIVDNPSLLEHDTSALRTRMLLKRTYHMLNDVATATSIVEMFETLLVYLPTLPQDAEQIRDRLSTIATALVTGSPIPDFDYLSTLDSEERDILKDSLILKSNENED